MDDANPYLAAAYLVFLALVLLYVANMAARLSRLERDLAELTRVDEDGKVHPEDVDGATAPAEREEARAAL